MEQRLSMVPLGMADLIVARQFYETGLHWKAAASSNENILFFQLGALRWHFILE